MKNILIVEDSQEIIDLIKIYLEQEEYSIYEACDGESAINIFEKEEIHLVVLDIMLPKLNGYEVIKRLRGVMYRLLFYLLKTRMRIKFWD